MVSRPAPLYRLKGWGHRLPQSAWHWHLAAQAMRAELAQDERPFRQLSREERRERLRRLQGIGRGSFSRARKLHGVRSKRSCQAPRIATEPFCLEIHQLLVDFQGRSRGRVLGTPMGIPQRMLYYHFNTRAQRLGAVIRVSSALGYSSGVFANHARSSFRGQLTAVPHRLVAINQQPRGRAVAGRTVPPHLTGSGNEAGGSSAPSRASMTGCCSRIP